MEVRSCTLLEIARAVTMLYQGVEEAYRYFKCSMATIAVETLMGEGCMALRVSNYLLFELGAYFGRNDLETTDTSRKPTSFIFSTARLPHHYCSPTRP